MCVCSSKEDKEERHLIQFSLLICFTVQYITTRVEGVYFVHQRYHLGKEKIFQNDNK